MNNKSGISLIVLIITIVVILILTFISVMTLDHNINNTSIAAFINDLKEVEDSFGATILDFGKDGITTYSKSQVLTLVGEHSTDFQEELVLNKDDTENVFYVVNLKNIGITKAKRGNKTNDDEADIYVVTKNKMHAYYLKGIKVNNTWYFSISSKIDNM